MDYARKSLLTVPVVHPGRRAASHLRQGDPFRACFHHHHHRPPVSITYYALIDCSDLILTFWHILTINTVENDSFTWHKPWCHTHFVWLEFHQAFVTCDTCKSPVKTRDRLLCLKYIHLQMWFVTMVLNIFCGLDCFWYKNTVKCLARCCQIPRLCQSNLTASYSLTVQDNVMFNPIFGMLSSSDPKHTRHARLSLLVIQLIAIKIYEIAESGNTDRRLCSWRTLYLPIGI